MKAKNFLFLSVLLIFSVISYGQNLKLWYSRQATNWWEALPVGNGHLAAMVYGDVSNETIQFNEETFWAGGPYNNNNPNGIHILNDARTLIFEGQNDSAEKLLNANYFTKRNGMRYLPLADLKLNFLNQETYTDYYRDLNLENATATVKYTSNGVKFTRTVFASFTDGVIIVHITADKPLSLNFSVGYQSPLKSKIYRKGKALMIRCEGEPQDGIQAALHAISITTVKSNGTVQYWDSTIVVRKASEATVYLSVATNFVNYHDIGGNAYKKSENILGKALKVPYEKALLNHIAYYKNQFDRVSLQLDSSAESRLETDKRIERFTNDKDEALAALLFQYGRYLLISSSQPGSQPANLQGKWNCRMHAPWDSKYTININTEMNYWPAEVTNLSEDASPLFNMIKDLSVTGHETAEALYNCRGWVAHHNTDLWRACGPVDAAFYGMWPNGGAWLSQSLWQHYLFTADTVFLKKYYPILKGTADFYLDYMVKDPNNGWMVTAPSMSPEHGPHGKSSIIAGCTMDNQIAFDALNNTLLASQIVGERKSYQDSLKNLLSQLPPMQIGKYNQLQEWITDEDDPNDTHRHVSHLYGLYPSNQISPKSHPELFQAAKTSLILRGDMATGWSLAWKLNLWARLLDGNHAYKIIQDLLHILPNDSVQKQYPEGRTYPNLLTAHPPFQIDCNFGYTAGVAEMLLQSYDGAIQLLPALPDAWQKGSVKGLVARGGFIVEMHWDGAELTKAIIHSTVGGILRIRSYVPLNGKGLHEAKDDCPNPLYAHAKIKDPLVTPNLNPQWPILYKTYEYDIETEKGKTYIFTRL